MTTTIGIVVGFIGVFILLVPFIIQIYVATKQTTTGDKRALEASTVIMAIALFFYVVGIILAAYYAGQEIVQAYGKLEGGELKFIKEHPQLALLAA